jgi:hypothetical protein
LRRSIKDRKIGTSGHRGIGKQKPLPLINTDSTDQEKYRGSARIIADQDRNRLKIGTSGHRKIGASGKTKPTTETRRRGEGRDRDIGTSERQNRLPRIHGKPGQVLRRSLQIRKNRLNIGASGHRASSGKRSLLSAKFVIVTMKTKAHRLSTFA